MKFIASRSLTLIFLIGIIEFTHVDAVYAEDAPSVLVKTAPVISEEVTEVLTAFGVLDPDPDQVLSLSLPHAGLINRVWVRLGQRVRSGDELLEVVTSPDARMQYLQAQSAVDFARRELERQNRLLSEQLATKAQVDAAKKNLKDAAATLNALKQRGQGVEKETLRAPMDGIITRLDISQGQRVQADTTALLIATEQRLIARLGIEPEDLSKIKTGMPVTITSVFVPEITINTEVREIHAMVDPATHLVEMLAAIPEKQIDHLVLGTRVLGRVQLDAHEALVVPRSAVLKDGKQDIVFTIQEGKAKRIAVTVGIDEGDRIEIAGDLKAGVPVVVTGNYELKDGMAVREAP
ncbi:MAG: efflux RND transporter periplasmic adaptor subunit [Thiotrichales bacterium]